jgi:hypothetical protein
MSDDLKITHKETVKLSKGGKISALVFNMGNAILGYDHLGISVNMHLSTDELYALGDAIQRIIAGSDGYSETKDDCADIVVGS